MCVEIRIILLPALFFLLNINLALPHLLYVRIFSVSMAKTISIFDEDCIGYIDIFIVVIVNAVTLVTCQYTDKLLGISERILEFAFDLGGYTPNVGRTILWAK